MTEIASPIEEGRPATVQLAPEPLLGPPPSRLEKLWALARWLWPIWLVAGATLSNGLLGIVSVLVVRFHERPALFNMPLPFGLYHWSRSLTLLFGFVLVYLSFHLLERRRTARVLALGGAVLAAAAHVGRGQQWYAALASLALVLLLLLFRKRYTVHSEPRSIARGVGLMLISLILALAYGTIGFWLLDRKDFGLEFRAVDALIRTLREFSLVGNSDLAAHTRHARWFLDSLHVAGLTAGAFALYSLFRPVAYRQRTLPQQRALMKSLLEQHGGTSVDYFKLWPDKSYFFSPDRECGIAYRTVGGIALVLGNPVGAPEALEATTRGFLRFCDDNGWEAAFDAVPADLLPMYHRLGLQSLKIGIEAIVPLDRLSDTVKHSKHLRHIRNKFEGEGYRFERHMPPHDGALMSQLREVSDDWLQIPGRRERSFTVGYFDEGYVNECPVVALQDPSGRLVAFANEIPSYRAGEATIDMMRHRPQAPNGAMDYLFIALMLALRETGYQTFNLGMAPLAGVGEGPDAALEERAAHELAEHATRIFSYKGMRDYKGKFDPRWEDRFLIYQGGPLGLARTVIALVRTTEHSPLGQK